jgi:hypothetical protein
MPLAVGADDVHPSTQGEVTACAPGRRACCPAKQPADRAGGDLFQNLVKHGPSGGHDGPLSIDPAYRGYQLRPAIWESI